MLLKFAIIALFYGLLACGPFFAFFNPLREPVVIGCVIGLILGDPAGGAIAGANIGLVYLGAITIAGQMPSNRMVGSVIGVTFALVSGLGFEASLAIAVPLGLATANLRNWVETAAVVFGSGIPKAVHDHQPQKMWFWAIANVLFKVALYTALMFAALQLGVTTLADMFAKLPEWVLNGLNVGGAVLPGVGLALGLTQIGDRGRIFLSVAAFIAAKMMGLSTLACVLIVLAVVVVMVYKKIDSGELHFGSLKDETAAAPRQHILSFKDVFMGIFTSSNNAMGEDMARKNSNNFILGMWPIMKKLYPNDLDKQCEELAKHDSFIDMFAAFMGFVAGPVIMMEEERALGNESVTPESIQAFKASLQAPVRALGDSLGAGVIMIIVNTVGISMAQSGNILGGAVTYIGEFLLPTVACYLSAYLCYKYGASLIEKLYNGSTTAVITEMVGIIGCVAFGSLAATSMRFSTGDLAVFGINLQTTLFDAILPGLLPLSLMLVCYALLRKNKINIVPLITLVFVICFALGALGILAA